MQTPEFLEIADILDIHQILIEQFGGMSGIRDEGLLESALSQPQATFFGELLHPQFTSKLPLTFITLLKTIHF